MAEKRFKCTLYGECENADQGNIIIENETEFEGGEYYCTCGQHNKLVEIEKKSIPKWAYGAAAAVVLVVATVLMLPGADDSEVNKKKDPPVVVDSLQQEPTKDMVAVLHTELSKIGDNVNLSMPERQQMVEPTLRNYFTTEQTPYVKRVGENGTLIETLTAEEYLNRLSGLITLSRLEVVDALQDSQGKVREIIVREVHQTSLN